VPGELYRDGTSARVEESDPDEESAEGDSDEEESDEDPPQPVMTTVATTARGRALSQRRLTRELTEPPGSVGSEIRTA
jgi:hypothetical protein